LGAKSGPGIKKNPIHGTYCASIIAAEANNNFCGVGVAFNARVGGVRLLAKKRVLDVQEARALNYKLNEVDIYSASWGEFNNSKSFHFLFYLLLIYGQFRAPGRW
jgi:subtilisin family serine protease